MHTITATLALDNASEPPRVSASVQVDGDVVAELEQPSAADCIAALAAFANNDPEVLARLRTTVQETVDKLQQAVDREHSAQATREAALAEWQQVLADAAAQVG